MKNIFKIDVVIPVFEEIEHLQDMINMLNSQLLPSGYCLNILIVDDASTDGTADFVEVNLLSEIVSLLRLKINGGPAIARNKGVFHGNGQFIILMDADCLPESSRFILEHIENLKKSDISCGAMFSNIPESSFWSQYQNEVFDNRESEYYKKKEVNFTTSNLAFTREQFLNLEGFNEEYFFGFEDRDFLLRAKELDAKISYAPKARVIHKDDLSLVSICKKMNRGGQVESNIFRKRHPQAYKKMPYYKVDTREHSYLRLIAKYIAPLAVNNAWYFDQVLRKGWVPYKIKKIMVKSMTAFSFMKGTYK